MNIKEFKKKIVKYLASTSITAEMPRAKSRAEIISEHEKYKKLYRDIRKY